jgi:hypothetical protein
MNHSTIKTKIYMSLSASWYSAESILFNLWSPGVIGGHNRVEHFYICFNGENLWKSFQKPTVPKNVQIYWQGDLMAIKKSNVACVHRRNISQYDSGERCGPWASCLFYSNKSTKSTALTTEALWVILVKGKLISWLQRCGSWNKLVLLSDHSLLLLKFILC